MTAHRDRQLAGAIRPKRLASGFAAFCVVAAAVAVSAGATVPPPLSLTPVAVVDGANQILDVSCVSTVLCVAVDGAGDALTSTDPDAGVWSPPVDIDGSTPMYGVACASASLCVAVDAAGDLLTSTDPVGGGAAWSAPTDVDEPETLLAVSCPSDTLCAAVDYAGGLVTSTDPTGGAGAWSAPVDIDGSAELSDIDCPSISLCVAVDQAGDVLTSTDPTGGAAAWTAPADVDGTVPLNAVSCTGTFCAAVDSDGNVFESPNPTGGSSDWSATNIDAANPLNSISCAADYCTAVDNSGQILTQSPLPSGAPGGTWTATGAVSPSLFAVSCPTSGLCVATGDAGSAVVAAGSSLSVGLAGSGAGAVGESSGALSCPTACTAWYPTGTTVSLTATAAAGSTFADWTGAGCAESDTADPCALTLTADENLTATFRKATPPLTPAPGRAIAIRITKLKVTARAHRATIAFVYQGHGTRFQCALSRLLPHRRVRPRAPRYRSCRSPKTYAHLAAGRYRFSVRVVAGTRRALRATRTFTMRPSVDGPEVRG